MALTWWPDRRRDFQTPRGLSHAAISSSFMEVVKTGQGGVGYIIPSRLAPAVKCVRALSPRLAM
eukprot:13965756-Alexandrium_andersonii.AAC.1